MNAWERMTKTDGWLATRSVLGGVRKHAKYSCSHLPICRGDGRQSDRKSWPNIGAIRCGRGKVQADALAKAQALAAATQNAAAAGRKRAEEAKRIKLITKRSVEAEISRTNGAAHKAAQAQFNIASRVPLSLRPAYPKHKANKAAA